jgi:Rieske Fe-S protein
LGFLYSLITMVVPAFAATKPSIKCRFAGQTTTYNGRLFTCIKANSKGKTVLAWDSGKIIPIPSPSPTQSATPSPSPSQVPEPVVVNKIDIPIAKSSEVPQNSTKSFAAKNRHGYTTTYFIVRSSDGLIGMNATCTHNGCTVKIENTGLLCPCHNALFDEKNGAVLRGPAAHPLERVSVREADGLIYITD